MDDAKNLPIVSGGYVTEISIRVAGVYHRVGRFGHVYNVTIADDRGILYALSNECGSSVIYSALALVTGDVAYITLEGGNGHRPVITNIQHTASLTGARCRICGKPVTASMGAVSCNNYMCAGRNKSKIYYFFKSLNVFESDEGLATFVKTCVEQSNVDLSITSAIYVLMNLKENGYHVAQENMYTLLDELKIAMDGMSLRDFKILGIIDFLMAMSLPTITYKDLTHILEVCVMREEILYLFSCVGELLTERGVDPDGIENSELVVISQLVYSDDVLTDLL